MFHFEATKRPGNRSSCSTWRCRVTVESQTGWAVKSIGVASLHSDSVRLSWLEACTFTITHWRPTSRNQEPHTGTWFNMKPPRAVVWYNDWNKAAATCGDSTWNTDIVVTRDIQTMKIDRRSGKVRFHIEISDMKEHQVWFCYNNRSDYMSSCAV